MLAFSIYILRNLKNFLNVPAFPFYTPKKEFKNSALRKIEKTEKFLKVPAFSIYVLKKQFKILYFETLKYLTCLLPHYTIWKQLKLFVCLYFTFSYALKNSNNIFYVLTFCLFLFTHYSSCFSRLSWSRLFKLRVNSTSCYSLKHNPGPTICSNHTAIHKLNFQKNLYLHMTNIIINYLWWKV